MTRPAVFRWLCVGLTCALVAILLWLDQTRGGPASLLSRCNLMLARAEAAPADVLILGTSRSAVALDPFALSAFLEEAKGRSVSVDRIAIGNNSFRAADAFLQTYLDRRGGPDVVVLELMFMSERTVNRLARAHPGTAAESYIYTRDINLMTYPQLLSQDAVGMPFTTSESAINLWHMRLRGLALRTGALTYQFAKHPIQNWQLSDCGPKEWTKEPEWAEDFAFSWGEFVPDQPLPAMIDTLEAEVMAYTTRALENGAAEAGDAPTPYAYDFDAPYRRGEMEILDGMVQALHAAGARTVLVPLTLAGTQPDPDDLARLAQRFEGQAAIFDVYGAITSDFSALWYDDAHVQQYPVGALTTTLMADHILHAASTDTAK
ncbi:hypothetical protein [uncultured Tateyamaria sp.]|uniref:hypothetical protein n=1 Tax=uncultured Tateyamaria sp. TaxID=455651 RepID=UPI002603E846|nr:hypothetical protein [uncultured Tateyamaria sp.]